MIQKHHMSQVSCTKKLNKISNFRTLMGETADHSNRMICHVTVGPRGLSFLKKYNFLKSTKMVVIKRRANGVDSSKKEVFVP